MRKLFACSLVGLVPAIGFWVGCGCNGRSSSDEELVMALAPDFSTDRYLYMGLYLQRAPQDVVLCTDDYLEKESNMRGNCWVSSRRESAAYNGIVRRYYSKKRKLPYRISVSHDFESFSASAMRSRIDELIRYVKIKSEGDSGLQAHPAGETGAANEWTWKYLAWEFTMKLQVADESGRNTLEISIICPAFLQAAKEDMRN